jgi:hypothetical protein
MRRAEKFLRTMELHREVGFPKHANMQPIAKSHYLKQLSLILARTTLNHDPRASGQFLQSRPASMQQVTSCLLNLAYGATTIVAPDPDSIAL